MATKKTPTVHVTTIPTSAIGHKKAIEDAVTRKRDDKKAAPTVLIHIVQTTHTMKRRTAGINARAPLINVKPLTVIIALRDANAHISMNRVTHPIPLHLVDSEKTGTTDNPNNSRVTMNSSITSLHTHQGTTGGRKSAHRNGREACQRQSVT
jgi:hypothetical protein